jgi:DNA (cytosine-5)-methyltransferase 1
VPRDGWENSGTVEGIPDAYGIAWRVLDAQYFGVPQRRRRVFLVGYLGDWRRAAAVLFERHSLQGNPPPRRQAGQNVAPTISARTKGGGGLGTDFDCDRGLIASTGEISHCLNAGGMGRQDYETETLIAHATGDGYWQEGFGTLRGREQDSHENLVAHALTGEGFDASEDGTGRGTPIVPVGFDCEQGGDTNHGYTENGVPPLRGKSGRVAVAFSCKDHGADAGEVAPTLRSMGHDDSHANGGGQIAVAFDTARMAVRRLTPRECERLQGFPDNYTMIPHRGKPAADGPRYKALGNSWAVPCARWIGRRIAMVEAMA